MTQQVLVTGAQGFIGVKLIQLLSQQGFQVRTLTRNATNDKTDNYSIDLTVDEFPSSLCAGIDTIFHLAGKAHALAENRQDAAEYRKINTEGTRKLLEAAQQAGVKRFVLFSSVKAVGYIDQQPMDETVVEPAETPYGQSKYEAEQLVLHGGYVPHPVVIRPSMVYGNTDKGNLPRMIKAVQRKVFPPLPEFHNHRSMVHVEDVVRAALLVAENPEAAKQVYIVTDGQSYSTRQIYDWIREALDMPAAGWTIPTSLLEGMANVGDGIGHLLGRRFPFDSDALQKLTGSAWYSSVKIERELGFSPQHTLQLSLPDIVRYLKSS